MFVHEDSRMVNGDRLENVCSSNTTEGSNPSLSAIKNIYLLIFENSEYLIIQKIALKPSFQVIFFPSL